jgi:hypothetical protein
MADKPIWKKALGFFVELDDDEKGIIKESINTKTNIKSSTGDLESLLADSKSALEKLGSVENINVSPDVSQAQVEKAVSNETIDDKEEIDFTQIYEAVGTKGKSIFDVEEILNAPELKTLPRETKAKAAIVTLRTTGSKIEEALQDGYNKDQALDAAEIVKKRKTLQKKQENEQKIQSIKKEVDDFLKQKNAEMEALTNENQDLDKSLSKWITAKLNEEKRIHDIVLHFVKEEESKITLGEVDMDMNSQANK